MVGRSPPAGCRPVEIHHGWSGTPGHEKAMLVEIVSAVYREVGVRPEV